MNFRENNEIVRVLMERDGCSREDALDLLNDARERVLDGENPEDILMDDFGLEPDYIFDLLWYFLNK